MSATLKNSRRRRLDAPFDPKVLARATQIAERYKILVWSEDGEYYGRGLEIPGAMADGRDPETCVANVRQALVAVVATQLERGQSPPAPAADDLRTEQVNVRLTAEEKLSLESAAHSKGFKGISDFVRAAAIAATRL